jgi:hypothetical protein
VAFIRDRLVADHPCRQSSEKIASNLVRDPNRHATLAIISRILPTLPMMGIPGAGAFSTSPPAAACCMISSSLPLGSLDWKKYDQGHSSQKYQGKLINARKGAIRTATFAATVAELR